MTGESSAPFAELEIVGDDGTGVCGPEGCEIPSTQTEEDPRL